MATQGQGAGQYKRSWKNLLINKRYQLRFTLFMVGVSAILMSGLGVWVMKEANEATTVSKIRVRGEACPKIPEVVEVPTGIMETPAVPMNIDETGSAAPKVAPCSSSPGRPPEEPTTRWIVAAEMAATNSPASAPRGRVTPSIITDTTASPIIHRPSRRIGRARWGDAVITTAPRRASSR